MKEDILVKKAVDHMIRLTDTEAAAGQRVVHCELQLEWYPDLLRTLSEHRLHILQRAADIVFFFNGTGEMTGWRDDGRKGSDTPAGIVRDDFLKAVQAELGLSKQTRLGKLAPAKLPPLGWTHQGVLFLAPTPRNGQILNVWVDPKTLKVIQCLKKAEDPRGGGRPSIMKESAEEEAQSLLARRLRIGGISTSRPEWYFQVEATEPEHYPEGMQIRVNTWRHWSNAAIDFDAANGELISWRIDRYSDPPNDAEITQDESLAIAQTLIDFPDDASSTTFQHSEFAPKRKLVRMEWEREYRGLPVYGDYLRINFHPVTHRLVQYQRKWRPLKLSSGSAQITSDEAVALVRQNQQRLDIAPEMAVESANMAIVEYKQDRLEPGPTEDHIAWIVTITSSWGWVEVHVDAVQRKVLTVLRSA